MTHRIIDVDVSGKDANGESFDVYAAPEAVAAGLVENVPVTLRYPNGAKVKAIQVRITPKGIEVLGRDLPVALRTPEGTA